MIPTLLLHVDETLRLMMLDLLVALGVVGLKLLIGEDQLAFRGVFRYLNLFFLLHVRVFATFLDDNNVLTSLRLFRGTLVG